MHNIKRRAVSPIIAMVLLIGLAVAAGAMLFITVLPMFEPQSNLTTGNVDYYYNEGLTTPKKNPKAQADAYVVEFTVYNQGTKVINIDSVVILDKNGEDMGAVLHTPEYLEDDLNTLANFDFLLSFIKKNNPPSVVRAQIVADGKTYYTEFIDLEN